MQHAQRLHWLDATRGIAAGAVLIEHTLAATFPAFNQFHQTRLDSGHAGVILFFFCSGYAISLSLSHTPLITFWIRRFFRLYPLYWFSILLALVTGVAATNNLDTVLANLTMLQSFLGYYHLIGIYWSLIVEMAFYIIISIFFLTKLTNQPLLVSSCLLFVAFIADVFLPLFGREPSGGWIASHLATISIGILFYHAHAQRIAHATAYWFLGLSLVIQLAGSWQAPEFFYARILGYAAFVLILRLGRDYTWPSWLIWCGTISYSIYLMHIIVLGIIAPTSFPGVVSVLVITLLVSACTYYSIEAPSMRLSRRLTTRKVHSNPDPAAYS